MPIYQASALARRAMSIYQTYIEMMNSDIQAAFQVLCSESRFDFHQKQVLPIHQLCTGLSGPMSTGIKRDERC